MSQTRSLDNQRSGNREDIIDVARGFAMLFVCLSHFATVYLTRHDATFAANVMSAVGMLASPAFVCLSGTMLGMSYTRRRQDFSRFHLKLADRALFLLSVGHVLMLLSVLPGVFDSRQSFGWVFVTDAIAFALLVAPWLMPRLSGRERILAGVLLLSLSWLIVDDWQPRAAAETLVKSMFFGDTERYWFPLIPWFGIYLASTAFGEHLAGILERRDYAQVASTMMRIGGSLVLGSVLLGALRWTAIHAPIGAFHDSRGLGAMTSIWQKYPPGPAYVLFFGGVGLVVNALLVQLWRRSLATGVLRTFSAVGRSSLFIYVLQAQVFFVLYHYVRIPYLRAWPLLLLVTLAPMAAAAWWWSTRNMNRYLTVGLPSFVAAVAARRDPLLRTEG